MSTKVINMYKGQPIINTGQYGRYIHNVAMDIPGDTADARDTIDLIADFLKAQLLTWMMFTIKSYRIWFITIDEKSYMTNYIRVAYYPRHEFEPKTVDESSEVQKIKATLVNIGSVQISAPKPKPKYK